MKQPGYYEKRDQAFSEHDAVEKLKKQNAVPKGAASYIKQRKANLKKVRGY